MRTKYCNCAKIFSQYIIDQHFFSASKICSIGIWNCKLFHSENVEVKRHFMQRVGFTQKICDWPYQKGYCCGKNKIWVIHMGWKLKMTALKWHNFFHKDPMFQSQVIAIKLFFIHFISKNMFHRKTGIKLKNYDKKHRIWGRISNYITSLTINHFGSLMIVTWENIFRKWCWHRIEKSILNYYLDRSELNWPISQNEKCRNNTLFDMTGHLCKRCILWETLKYEIRNRSLHNFFLHIVFTV